MTGLWIALCMLALAGPYAGWHARLIVLEHREAVVKWRQRMADDMLRMAQAVREQTAEMLYADRPEPQPVQVVEVIPFQRTVDILSSAPVHLAEVPTFASVPFTYPVSVPDTGFHWGPLESWTVPTGALPVLDDGRVGRERFATPEPEPKAKPRKRKVSVKVGDEVRSELVSVE